MNLSANILRKLHKTVTFAVKKPSQADYPPIDYPFMHTAAHSVNFFEMKNSFLFLFLPSFALSLHKEKIV